MKKLLMCSALLASACGLCAAVFTPSTLRLSQTAIEVDAVTSTTVYCAVDMSAEYGGSTISPSSFKLKCNVNFKGDGDEWARYDMTNTGDTSTYSGKTVFVAHFDDKYDGLGCIQFQVFNGDSWVAQDQVFGTQSWQVPSIYNGKLRVYGGDGWVNYEPPGTVYHVKHYAVLDGVKQNDPIRDDEVLEGASYAIPSNPHIAGYHFDKWYTDEGCTAQYSAQSIAGDLNLYAKFTSLENDSYVYYVTGSTVATSNFVSSFGGDGQYQTGAGVSIASIATEIHGVVNFQGTEQLIYKIPYSTTANDTHLILTNGSWGVGNQTANLLLVPHSAYWWSNDNDYHNDEAGEALDFIVELESIRRAVIAGASTKAQSVCGISQSDAASLCAKYNGLSETARTTYVDSSNVWTYKDAGSSEADANISIYNVMEQLASQAGGVVLNGHAARALPIFSHGSEGEEGMLVALVCTASIAALAAGFIALRKRKAE